MNEHTVDTIARRAATAVSRRASLLTLGVAGLASLTRPHGAEAKKNKNKKCKKDKKECKQDLEACNALCPNQVTDCTSFITANCGTSPNCQRLLSCCPLLGTCDATAFLSCVNSLPSPPA